MEDGTSERRLVGSKLEGPCAAFGAIDADDDPEFALPSLVSSPLVGVVMQPICLVRMGES